MLSITASNVKAARENSYSFNETCILSSVGVVLHPQLVSVMPKHTLLTPLTSVGDTHCYRLKVVDYTVEQFIAIALAYARGIFDEALWRSTELQPATNERD